MFVPVVDQNQQPLMPTTPARARRWIESRKATPFWKRGVFCVRLNVEPSARETQEIAVGIDPGSKREGFTVKSEAHTFLNLHVEARTGVKESVETRRNMRRARRFRKTPCRQNRKNRSRGGLPPSTKARWQWKLRIAAWLCQMFPVSRFVVEDIAAVTKKGQRRWNKSFSTLEVGKNWFYEQLGKLAPVSTKQGFETKALRDAAGLKKTSKKLEETFDAHCVDSWALANSYTGGHIKPDNTTILCLAPIDLRRRQLHLLQPAKGGERRRHGGTRSLGFQRGSIVKHVKRGIVFVGGTMGDRISLHALGTGNRLTQTAKPADCRFRSHNSWRTWAPTSKKKAKTGLLPTLKDGVSTPEIR
jgi:hypothetical protein